MYNNKWNWVNDNVLYLYYNEEKLTALLSQIFDTIKTEFHKSTKKGTAANLKLAAKSGSLLSWLGIGEASAEVEGELNKESTTTFISKVSTYQLLKGLICYAKENQEFPCYDVFNSLRCEEYKMDTEFSMWSPIFDKFRSDSENKISGIGKIGGRFKARRINPKPQKKVDLLRDILDEKKNLWILETVSNSEVKCKIPFLTSNFRHTSQGAMPYLNDYESKVFSIQCVGLISWENNSINCDPLAWGVLDDK